MGRNQRMGHDQASDRTAERGTTRSAHSATPSTERTERSTPSTERKTNASEEWREATRADEEQSLDAMDPKARSISTPAGEPYNDERVI